MLGQSHFEHLHVTRGVEALYTTAHWLFSQGRHRDAGTVFQAMLSTTPGDERGWVGLASCHEALGQNDVAKELYGAGRMLAQPAGRCEVGLARLARQDGETELALEALDRAEEIARTTEDDELTALVLHERRAES
jgi:tetratricopeptide (TPR) repeat protein